MFLYVSETALKLDTLVGEIEDAVMSSLNKNLRTSRSSGFEVSTFSSAKSVLYKKFRTCVRINVLNFY